MTRAMQWEHVIDGYASGDYIISDQGGGFGPARGSGRWAVIHRGKWLASIDHLTDAKHYAEEHRTQEA